LLVLISAKAAAHPASLIERDQIPCIVLGKPTPLFRIIR
jgi:hypothetical protein